MNSLAGGGRSVSTGPSSAIFGVHPNRLISCRTCAASRRRSPRRRSRCNDDPDWDDDSDTSDDSHDSDDPRDPDPDDSDDCDTDDCDTDDCDMSEFYRFFLFRKGVRTRNIAEKFWQRRTM